MIGRQKQFTPVLLAFCLGWSALALAATPELENSAAVATVQPLPLKELRTFTEIFARIKSAYVEPVEDAELLENAIKGMLSGLDPHSSYLDPEAFTDLRVSTSGEFGGLGIEVSMENGFVRVVAPIDDTPAQRAGVLAGDMIIKLDSKAVKGMGLQDAVKLMRGKVGTDIVLTIIREGEASPLEITLTRAIVKVTSVKNRVLDDNYGYLRIAQFQVNTGPDLVKAMEKLNEKNDIKGYVLDLRNNPGGVLQAAVQVSDAFLSDGIVVYTKGRLKQAELSFSATKSNPSGGLPLVVLINGGSASASEIVAGALQDHQRGVVMGTQSFGKGSVQTVLPLANDRALKLTTARYYTPNGRSIQAEGIVPDILVEPSKVTRVEGQGHTSVKEVDLQGHLSNGNKKAVEKDKVRNGGDVKLLSKDYQLNEALNLLKGISIYQRASTIDS
ncbi:MAG: S41 family peptidase [Motiliproteus sp.]